MPKGLMRVRDIVSQVNHLPTPTREGEIVKTIFRDVDSEKRRYMCQPSAGPCQVELAQTVTFKAVRCYRQGSGGLEWAITVATGL